MPTIVTRLGKGSPLTTTELDANLTNINAETVDNSGVFNLRPSLDIDLVGSKSVSPLVSFSRGSTGTYYDGKTTVKAEENLLTYSQDFDNGIWRKRLASITSVNSDTAPDGTLTADRITVTATVASTGALIYRSASSTSQVTLSCFLKYGSGNGLVFLYADAPTFKPAYFNLLTGTVGVVASGLTNACISYAGNGWYRCSITASNSTFIGIGISNIDGDTAYASTQGDYVIAWGMQLEQRAYPTAYTPTTSNPITNYIPVLQTASANVPRFNYDPITTELKGMLVEEQRTNLLSYSSDFDNAAWRKTNATVQTNVAIAPDGTLSADKLISSSINGQHQLNQFVTVAASTTYTFSIYAKQADYNQIRLTLSNYFSGGYATVSLIDGSVVNQGVSPSPIVSSIGNGWYKISITQTSIASSGSAYIRVAPCSGGLDSYTGDGYSGIYIWGAQLEQGTNATSYIPTPLTYTGRNSTATYRGDNGYLTTAAINEARYERNAQGGMQLLLEGASANLLTNTGRFNTGWSAVNVNVLSDVVIAPDGTMTADKIIANTTGSVYHCVRMSYSVVNGSTYTASCYMKAGEQQYGCISDNGFALFSCKFNLTGSGSVADTIGAVTASSIVNVGGGWYKCSVTFTAGANQVYVAIGGAASSADIYSGGPYYTGNGISGIYAWGAQLETGSVATSYIPSIETFTSRASTATYFNSSGVLTTAASNVARNGYGYDSIRNQWVSQGLILEAAATNLLLNSNTQSGVYNASVAANIVAPDGTNTGNTITAIAAGSVSYAGNYYASFTAGTSYTFSLFVKQGASRYVNVSTNSSSVFNVFATFDLQTGSLISASSGVNATIQYAGNGWYRLSASGTSTVSGSQTVYAINATSGGGNLIAAAAGEIQLYSWGAQLETGSVATSYIPTTSAQVTRAADVYTSTAGSRAADVYSSSTVTRSADQLSINKTSNWFNSTNGTLSLSHDAASGQPLLGDGSSTIISSLGAGTVNIDYSNTQLSVVTQSGQANNTTGIFNFDTDLYIGGNSTSKINNHIKYLKFYPNNVINSTPDGSGLLLDTGFALLQEDGSVIFQE